MRGGEFAPEEAVRQPKETRRETSTEVPTEPVFRTLTRTRFTPSEYHPVMQTVNDVSTYSVV